MKIQSSKLDTIVDKIYNLIFGYLDSLFDDSLYEQEESTIPKSQVDKPENIVDVYDKEIDPDEVEVSGDAKVVKFLSKPVASDEGAPASAQDLDEFEVQIIPGEFFNDPGYIIVVKNKSTGKTAQQKFVPEKSKDKIEQIIKESKKEISSTVKISLTKVTGSTGAVVKLKNVYSNYDLPSTCTDITCVLDDTAFIDSLPDGDSAYRIDSYNDGYEVNELQNCQFSNSVYTDALDCCIKTLARLSELRWYAKGIDYNNYNSIVESLTYNIQYNVNELAKLCIIHGYETRFEAKSSDAASVLDKWGSLRECVSGYISSLQLLVLAATEDEKDMINAWVRTLNDIILYQWSCLNPTSM